MTPRRREWDGHILRTCFYNHDMEEIQKIQLSDRLDDDVAAWYCEKSGVFSVRSAYRIALQQEQEAMDQPGSSTMPDGTRTLFKGFLLGSYHMKDLAHDAIGNIVS
jgi:hypothetical protein